MDSEISVHGWLDLLFLSFSEAEHYGGRLWRSKDVSFMVVSKQRDRRAQGQNTVSGNTPLMTYFLQRGPTS
jgi:hypothetical protein